MQLNIGTDVNVDLQSVMTGRGCVIGQSGSGKSFLIGVIAEELCRLHAPFCIIDTEGEYSSLKSMFEVLVVGTAGDIKTDIDFTKLFTSSIQNDIPVVLDISDALDKEDLVGKALNALYELESSIRRPYLVIVEEADKLAPQVVHKPGNMLEEISVRGRKRGIGLIVATQRPANISKNVLAQCSYGFIGKLTINNDVKAVDILFENKQELNKLVNLKVGEFIPFGIDYQGIFSVKSRLVKHIGSTPLVGAYKAPSEMMSTIVAQLEQKNKMPILPRAPRETGASTKINAIFPKFSQQDAESFARKMLKKKFVLFGGAAESLDSIENRYLQMALCFIRIGTGRRNEYKEYGALIDSSGCILNVNKKPELIRPKFKRNARLNDNEARLLYVIAAHGKINIRKAQKKSKLDDEAFDKAIVGLESKGFIAEVKDNVVSYDYRRYLIREKPLLEEKKVSKQQLIGSQPKEQDVKKLISGLYPGSSIISIEPVSLPLYKITLRGGGKVRIFTIDAISGKETGIAG